MRCHWRHSTCTSGVHCHLFSLGLHWLLWLACGAILTLSRSIRRIASHGYSILTIFGTHKNKSLLPHELHSGTHRQHSSGDPGVH